MKDILNYSLYSIESVKLNQITIYSACRLKKGSRHFLHRKENKADGTTKKAALNSKSYKWS